MTATVYGRTLPSFAADRLRSAVEWLLERGPALDGASTVAVVPDVHYPYHPSTGLVTNPAVVEAALDVLAAGTDARRLVVGCASEGAFDGDRVAQYVGYDRIATQFGADLVDLGADVRFEATVETPAGPVEFAVPRTLESSAVLVVPTLRTSTRFGVAAGTVTLARAVCEESPTASQVAAASRACPPWMTLLDATYAYAGGPQRSRFLLAGDRPSAVDGVAARLLGHRPTSLSYLGREATRADVEGVSPGALAARLPSRPDGPSRAPSTSGPLGAAYRLYARVTGDAVPPQFVG